MPYADYEQGLKARREYQKTPEGKRRHVEATQRYRQRNAKKYKAVTAVNNAVRDGRLFKPDSCSECGVACSPHGHHDDYDFPMDVRWVCDPCHKEIHRKMKEG